MNTTSVDGTRFSSASWTDGQSCTPFNIARNINYNRWVVVVPRPTEGNKSIKMFKRTANAMITNENRRDDVEYLIQKDHGFNYSPYPPAESDIVLLRALLCTKKFCEKLGINIALNTDANIQVGNKEWGKHDSGMELMRFFCLFEGVPIIVYAKGEAAIEAYQEITRSVANRLLASADSEMLDTDQEMD